MIYEIFPDKKMRVDFQGFSSTSCVTQSDQLCYFLLAAALSMSQVTKLIR